LSNYFLFSIVSIPKQKEYLDKGIFYTGNLYVLKGIQRMPSRLIEIFEDTELVEKIKKRLHYFFQLAEPESSRAGKIGMQVGSTRENVRNL